MSFRTVILVLLAVVSGASAAVGIKRLHNHQPAAPEMVSIVVAAKPLARGGVVARDSVMTREYPKELVPDRAITQVEDAVGRCVFAPMAKDEPLLDSKLAAKGRGGLEGLVRKAMRAFTISTPSLPGGIGGFVLPGNNVDVLLTVASIGSNDDTGGGSTTTLLQNVEVLAVDQRVEVPIDPKADPKEPRSVTLLVSPDQAAQLDLGQNRGTLHLSLRNPDDKDAAITRPALLSDLRFRQEKPQKPWEERAKEVVAAVAEAMAKVQKQKEAAAAARPPQPPPMGQIRMIKGVHESVVNFELP